MNPESDISIVVPIYNESESLRQLLTAISKQTLLPREIVFVDSGSNDNSLAVIREFAEAALTKTPIRTVINSGGLPGGNRNRGVNESCGEWIAFLDGGIVPRYDWLESLMACAISKNIKAVYGQCHFDADTAFQKAVCAVSYGCGSVHPVLPASLFHRSVFTRVGWFREDLRAAEDLLWLKDLEKALGPRQICPNALVYYRNFPPDFKQLVRKWWRYERHMILSGIVNRGQMYLSLFSLVVMISVLILFPRPAVLLTAFSIVARGLISPMRRSGSWHWWRKTPLALPIAIGVCFTRDVSKALARVFYLLRPANKKESNSKG